MYGFGNTKPKHSPMRIPMISPRVNSRESKGFEKFSFWSGKLSSLSVSSSRLESLSNSPDSFSCAEYYLSAVSRFSAMRNAKRLLRSFSLNSAKVQMRWRSLSSRTIRSLSFCCRRSSNWNGCVNFFLGIRGFRARKSQLL